jgi:quinol monooxygenase YgiN
MVRLSIIVRATSARGEQALLDALRFVVLNTRVEPGCVSSSAWTAVDGVHYVEEWKTEADMRQRVRSEAFTPLLAIVESASKREVHFDFITSTRGLDYVAEMRTDAIN